MKQIRGEPSPSRFLCRFSVKVRKFSHCEKQLRSCSSSLISNAGLSALPFVLRHLQVREWLNRYSRLMARKRTPQEKKVLSYMRDTRNVYGANDKGSRKSIRRRKRQDERQYRRAVSQDMRSTPPNAEDTASSSVERRSPAKAPDAPLAEFLDWSRRPSGGPVEESALRAEAKRRLRRRR